MPTGQADVLIGCDIVMSAKPDTFGYLNGERTVAIVNDGLTPTAAFVTDNTIDYDMAAMRARIARASRRIESIDAEELALRLLGDTIYANMFQTGYAYQLGEIPIGEEAILKAIELNGAAVKANQRAFRLGRLAAHDRPAILKMAGLDKPDAPKLAETYEEIVAKRVEFLTAYQNAAYAERYRAMLDRVRAAEAIKAPGKHGLAEAAARALFKLMAYKDEYEVARLYTNGEFHKKLHEEFEGNFTLSFHLAPPIFGATDPNTGRPRKMEFGSYMMTAFRVLAALKGLRGTWLDIFARNPERKLEVKMIGDYEKLLGEIAGGLTPANHATAVALAELPLDVKGYGYIKDGNYEKAKAKEAALLRRLHMTDAERRCRSRRPRNERLRFARFRSSRSRRLLRRQEVRPEGDHRHPFHRAGPGLRRHAHVSLRHARRGADRCAAPVARHELQERHRRSAARRRQGRDHRQSGDRQVGCEVRRLCRGDQHARRALRHGDGCRHPAARHAGDRARHQIHRGLRPARQGRRRQRPGHGARRVRRPQGRREASPRRRHDQGPARRDPGPGQGRHGRRQAAACRRRQADRRRHEHGGRQGSGRDARRASPRRRTRS